MPAGFVEASRILGEQPFAAAAMQTDAPPESITN